VTTLAQANGVDFQKDRILEIGLGNGFYAQMLQKQGVSPDRYLGLDITDVNFAAIRRMAPGFRLERCDITATKPAGRFDVVLLIDVTQHIVDPVRFVDAMKNIQACLAPGGVLIVSSWLDSAARDSFYEKSRDLATYQSAFSGWQISDPLAYRDKWIFTVKKEKFIARRRKK